MKIAHPFALFLTSALFLNASAFEPPSNSELIVADDFERSELGQGWTTQTGSWQIVDGLLTGEEIEADKHSAAARRVVETEDAVYELKFRLSDTTKGFHFGFDPKRGELEKRGHLFSVVISPKNWKILKHVDKDKPKEDPNEVLATANHKFEAGEWYTLRVVTWGTTVKAMIENYGQVEAIHPTFGVAKPTLVFRVIGGEVDIDDIKVWKPAQ